MAVKNQPPLFHGLQADTIKIYRGSLCMLAIGDSSTGVKDGEFARSDLEASRRRKSRQEMRL